MVGLPPLTGASADMPPVVGLIMGSQTDWTTMRYAANTLQRLNIPFEKAVVSAHRTPERLYCYAKDARSRGLKVLLAGAGGAAHLPGMCAALTSLPVFGVPIESRLLNGLDSLLSIVQMPAGVPVGTTAVGKAGAVNAALLAASVLALFDPGTEQRLQQFRAEQTSSVSENVHEEAASCV